MAVESALTMSVFMPKRINCIGGVSKDCSKSDLRNIQTVQSLAWRQLIIEAEQTKNKSGSSVQNSTEKVCPLVQLPLQVGKHTAQRNVELSST